MRLSCPRFLRPLPARAVRGLSCSLRREQEDGCPKRERSASDRPRWPPAGEKGALLLSSFLASLPGQ